MKEEIVIEENKKKVPLKWALLIIAGVTVIIMVCLLWLKLPTRGTLILCLIYLGAAAVFLGNTLKDVEKYILDGFKNASLIVGIFLAVGLIIGSWIVSGIIPSIIYYGISFLTPSTYLVTGLILCSLTSYFTGTSFGTIGTVGVALVGVAGAIGVPLPIAGGMIISGALFGDKMSPFSDTTNLSAATAGTPLFTHIHSMLYTGGPAILISLLLFGFIGLQYDASSDIQIVKAADILANIDSVFLISPLFLVIPILTVVMIARKIPAIPAMVISAMIATVVALIFQPSFSAREVIVALFTGLDYEFTNADTAKLLNRGGISSMAWIITTALIVLAFGEILNRTGVLKAILKSVEKWITTPARLIIITVFSCLATNMLSASQYVSIIIPGETLRPEYKRLKVDPKVLSRTLEDSGTLFAFLVPWGNDAIFAAGVLGIATLDYAPYAFFLLICPVLAILYALTNTAVWYTDGRDLKKVKK